MKEKQIWFITGSQHLYGDEALKQVVAHSMEIAAHIHNYKNNPCTIVFKGVVTTPEEVKKVCNEANFNDNCIGVITWMHTFSPAKMWINGLKHLVKPQLHLHTQYYHSIPWSDIDMDYMNLHQSAHGDREYGFINTRLRIKRKVVVGFWKDEKVLQSIADWSRVAAAYHFSNHLKVVRFGDNMRQVAVTEGDKVEAEIQLGWSINGYGVGDLVNYINEVTENEVSEKLEVYRSKYIMNTDRLDAVAYQARIEVALERFLKEGGFHAFTTTFEDLHGLKQLPGLAVQHLMENGYGFGAEGDWKISALTAVLKYMAKGLPGGTTFMEDYTYHLVPGEEAVLGAHMLEVCPTIASEKPRIEVHPLSIGDREDPARLVFNGKSGDAVLVTIVDLGDRFRMIAHKIHLLPIEHDMPKLPVARVLWKLTPDFKTGSSAWIYAGGAHHSVLSTQVTMEQLSDLAKMMGIEFVSIDEQTKISQFEKDLEISDIIWRLKNLK